MGGGGGGGKRDSIGAGQAPGSPLPSPRGAVMQGVRDQNEEDVSRAGRMELERALREEWEAKDRVSDTF